MKIADIREETKPITSDIRNAHIDFSKMTLSLVAVVTDVVREDRPGVVCGSPRTAAAGGARRRTAGRLHAAYRTAATDVARDRR
jgi:hypothetical protein